MACGAMGTGAPLWRERSVSKRGASSMANGQTCAAPANPEMPPAGSRETGSGCPGWKSPSSNSPANAHRKTLARLRLGPPAQSRWLCGIGDLGGTTHKAPITMGKGAPPLIAHSGTGATALRGKNIQWDPPSKLTARSAFLRWHSPTIRAARRLCPKLEGDPPRRKGLRI